MPLVALALRSLRALEREVGGPYAAKRWTERVSVPLRAAVLTEKHRSP
jgi:hypothetical protein